LGIFFYDLFISIHHPTIFCDQPPIIEIPTNLQDSNTTVDHHIQPVEPEDQNGTVIHHQFHHHAPTITHTCCPQHYQYPHSHSKHRIIYPAMNVLTPYSYYLHHRNTISNHHLHSPTTIAKNLRNKNHSRRDLKQGTEEKEFPQ